MPTTDLLERNSKLYGGEAALVEINPEIQGSQRVTWKEYSLIQPTSVLPYRREITWSVFDEKANRVAHMLLGRGELRLEDFCLDQWRLMHVGAQPVPPSLIRRWKHYFLDHKYDTNYGLSESCGSGCVHLGMENIHKVGAIGVPVLD